MSDGNGPANVCDRVQLGGRPDTRSRVRAFTDTGGHLAHAAIIAREYRVPGVLATGNATELLRDGQLVTVDGSAGIVELQP